MNFDSNIQESELDAAIKRAAQQAMRLFFAPEGFDSRAFLSAAIRGAVRTHLEKYPAEPPAEDTLTECYERLWGLRGRTQRDTDIRLVLRPLSPEVVARLHRSVPEGFLGTLIFTEHMYRVGALLGDWSMRCDLPELDHELDEAIGFHLYLSYTLK